MLGGLDPVVIFEFSTRVIDSALGIESMPVKAGTEKQIALPVIPVYLSEKIFNIAIGGVTKQVDIETNTQGMTDGSESDVTQNPIQSSIDINITGKRDSVALILLSALVDQVYDKATSQEYKISFLYGPTTIFRAVLHSFSSEMVDGTDKLAISIKLSKGAKNPAKKSEVGAVPGQDAPIPVGRGF